MSKSISLHAIIPEDLTGLRLDQALARLFPEYSRSRLQTWVREEKVLVDRKALRAKDKIQAGQAVTVEADMTPEVTWEAQPIPLEILYEDSEILVIHKPAGLVVHPAAGNPDRTLVNALLHHAPELAQLPRAGIVHRLDKETSGILVVARTLEAHTHLIKQIQNRTMKREYIAITQGVMTGGGTVDAPMGRDPHHRKQMAVVESGKEAITHYRVLERFRANTYVNVFLETGRTHQIRVHLAYIGYPLVGDPLYGGRMKIPKGCSETLKQHFQTFKRQALHARKLTFLHPKTGAEMSWETPIPEDMDALLNALRSE